jgi:hypothetical protein
MYTVCVCMYLAACSSNSMRLVGHGQEAEAEAEAEDVRAEGPGERCAGPGALRNAHTEGLRTCTASTPQVAGTGHIPYICTPSVVCT